MIPIETFCHNADLILTNTFAAWWQAVAELEERMKEADKVWLATNLQQ